MQLSTTPAEAPPSDITYTDGYDGNGNAIYSVDGNSIGTEQQYDPLNRLIKTLQDHAGTGTTKDTATQYVSNQWGQTRLIEKAREGGRNLPRVTRYTSYTYDAAGNRKAQTDARGVVAMYSYDALNRLTGIVYTCNAIGQIDGLGSELDPSVRYRQRHEGGNMAHRHSH